MQLCHRYRLDFRPDTHGHAEFFVQPLRHLRVLLEVSTGVFAALPDALSAIAEPGAGLLDHVLHDTDVDEIPLTRSALAVKNVEFGFFERRSDLVLDDLNPRPIAHHVLAVFDRRDTADIDTHGRIELQSPASGCGLRAAEHHADLLADLVDEDHAGVGPRHHAGKFSQRLRHQPRMQADVVIAHIAVEFRLRYQRGDRVDDRDIDRSALDERGGDFERLFARVRLRYEQVVDVHAEFAGIGGIERMFGIDERRHTAEFLRLGDYLQRQRRFARRFRSVDLDHATAGES